MIEKKTVQYQPKAWPFKEARRLLETLPSSCKKVRFETGYGPSGLPHIGTFGEVVRTAMVQHAFGQLSSLPTELICFSDDLDGLRKVPDNVPNQDLLRPFLDFPLTKVPDPFGEFESFGHHNNQRLKTFLDGLGVPYTFMSATACYQSGLFDETLLLVLRHHRAILDLILPTLGAERQRTYSPFLPISPSTGRVLQVPVLEYKEHTIVFQDEGGDIVELPVTGGACKLQWKVDWGMRWKSLGIHYEMAGKDLIDSVTLATKVCRILGGEPPICLITEHFLDEKGGKISKSKGNGLSVETWLQYAPKESLSYFMYLSPQRAKRLHFDVIPVSVDSYLQERGEFGGQNQERRLENPAWHIHQGHVPEGIPLTFSLLLNLVGTGHGYDKTMLWQFIQRYDGRLSPETHPYVDQLVDHALAYYKDFVVPTKTYRVPTAQEREALGALETALLELPGHTSSQEIQTLCYETGKHYFPEVKAFFSCFYEVLLGQRAGPRLGSFIALYGIQETARLIREKLSS